MDLFMLKYDGDEVPSHPWTVVQMRLLDSGDLAVMTPVQTTSLESAVSLCQRLQRGEITMADLELDLAMDQIDDTRTDG